MLLRCNARSWSKAESADVNSLSKMGERNTKSCQSSNWTQNRMSTKCVSIFKDPVVNSDLSKLHDKFIFVPADKGFNNIVFVCKKYYFQCLIQVILPIHLHHILNLIDNHTSVLVYGGSRTICRWCHH